MKTLKVIIELEIKGDMEDQEDLKFNIYEYLQELIDTDDLFDNHCTVLDEDCDEKDMGNDF